MLAVKRSTTQFGHEQVAGPVMASGCRSCDGLAAGVHRVGAGAAGAGAERRDDGVRRHAGAEHLLADAAAWPESTVAMSAVTPVVVVM